MLPKRVWIPLLSVILCVIVGCFLYQQLPNRGRHSEVIKRASRSSYSRDSLQWLKRHQSNDGRWSARYYQFYCEDRDENTDSVFYSDISYTGLALLCYFVNGYDHKYGNYKRVVQAGLEYLLSTESQGGVFAKDNYQQAIATMAICGAYTMTLDPDLRPPAQAAVDVLCSRRQQYGWSRSQDDTNIIDFTVTAFSVKALETAESAGLDTGGAWSQLQKTYSTLWHEQNEKYSDGGAIHIGETYNVSEATYEGLDPTAFSFAISILGKRSGDIEFDSMIPSLMQLKERSFKDLEPRIIYMAIFSTYEYGGEDYAQWIEHFYDSMDLVRTDLSCAHGTIDPQVFASRSRFEAVVFRSLVNELHYKLGRPWGRRGRIRRKKR